jgi:hypothetical protein
MSTGDLLFIFGCGINGTMSETKYRKLISPLTRKNQVACSALFEQFSKVLLGEFSDVSPQLLSDWQIVPLYYVEAISRNTGIPPAEILPDPPFGLVWAPTDNSLASLRAAVENFKIRRNIVKPMTRNEFAEMQAEQRQIRSNGPAPRLAPNKVEVFADFDRDAAERAAKR